MSIIAAQDEDREQHKAELIEAIMRAGRHAHRQPYVIEQFAADRPTQWTKAHRYIDSLLDQYEATRG